MPLISMASKVDPISFALRTAPSLSVSMSNGGILISAIAYADIVFAKLRLEEYCHDIQNLVACLMSEPVVYILEIIGLYH